tara:strand:+ start:334 stop:564 length:231 start_codon:yes stop_codon:yes gene_type:complete
MPKITIDGVEYHSEDLSEQGRAQLASLQFLELQMQKINQELSVYQTAKMVYSQALKAEVEELHIAAASDDVSSDTT